MEFTFTERNGTRVAIVQATGIVIHEVQDALDMMAEARYQDCDNIIVKEEHLDPSFFDLKTGMAGEILQKFSNYRASLAIVGDFTKYKSKALQDFIRESNKFRRVNFVVSVEEGMERMRAGDG
ncbi:MAG TPA: DUF4180 domain-containing protein [Bacteroidales bacterium]|nr:DUF4180 domain-containing protein [Bacteroidales bacterium]